MFEVGAEVVGDFFVLGQGLKTFVNTAGEGDQFKGAHFQLHFVVLYFSEIEQLVGELQHPFAVFAYDFEAWFVAVAERSEEHTSELQSRPHLVCRLLLEKKKKKNENNT